MIRFFNGFEFFYSIIVSDIVNGSNDILRMLFYIIEFEYYFFFYKEFLNNLSRWFEFCRYGGGWLFILNVEFKVVIEGYVSNNVIFSV